MLKIKTFIFIFMFCPLTNFAQKYQNIPDVSKEINEKIKNYLQSTKNIKGRKVSVFDCDGTLLGQVPFYLSDEAIFSYAKENYKEKNDSLSIKKMNFIDKLTTTNDEFEYIQNSINFLEGFTQKEVERIGLKIYRKKYRGKFYPNMKILLSNLKKFGFEIWIITASPEYLYTAILHKELKIPKNRIIGLKSKIQNGYLTDSLITPYPQGKGKVEWINTLIQTTPLIVAGNSNGDKEMMHLAKDFTILVNPNKEFSDYWSNYKEVITLFSPDIRSKSVSYTSEYFSIKEN